MCSQPTQHMGLRTPPERARSSILARVAPTERGGAMSCLRQPHHSSRPAIALPILPSGIFTLHSVDIVPAVTTVPPKGVWGGGTLLCSPGFQGLVFAGTRTRLVRSLAQLPVQVDAVRCSRLLVLHCGSFISSCVLINRVGPLPAGSNSGWAVGEAPWEWEGACGKHSCAPGTHRNLPQSPWGLYYSRFWAKITQRRGFWLYLSLWGEMWLQGVPRPASSTSVHDTVFQVCRESRLSRVLSNTPPIPQQSEVLPDPFPHL